MRTAILTCLVVLTLGIAPAVADEGDITFRTYDLSLLTAMREHRSGPVLGATCTFTDPKLWIEMPENEPTPFMDGDQIVELIQEMVVPYSWEEYEGAMIEYRMGTLYVRNQVHVQEKVGKFLDELEKEASRRIRLHVEVYRMPAKSYRGADGPTPTDVDIEGELLESGTVETWPGVRTAFKVTNRVRILKDYEVEIAEAAVIAHPIVVAAEEGFAVSLIPHPTISGDRVLVEALVQRGVFDRPVRTLSLEDDPTDGPDHLGIVDLPLFRHAASYSSSVVTSGGTIDLPYVSDGKHLLVRIRTEVLGGSRSLGLLNVGVLTAAPHEYLAGQDFDGDASTIRSTAPGIILTEEPDSPLGSVEDVHALLVSTIDRRYWDEEGEVRILWNDRLIVRAKDEVRARVGRFLSARQNAVLHPVIVDFRVHSVPNAVRSGTEEKIDPVTARLLHAATISTLDRRGAFVMIGSTMNYLAGYDVEVAQNARIADPAVGQSFEGFLVNLRPHLSDDRSRVRLDLNLILARRNLAEEPVTTFARNIGRLDGLSEKRTVTNTSLEVPAGGTYTLDLGPDLDDPTRRVALSINVRVE